MKIIVQILFFTLLFTINNLYTSSREFSLDDLYILSSSYLKPLQKESEENLELLEQVYETVEKSLQDQLKELLKTHSPACERFLGNYLENPIRPPLLHLAVIRGNKDIIKILLEYNADINLPDRTFIGNYNTPLHYAALLNKPTRPAICQILISKGALVNIRNTLGKTPLYLACENFDDPYVPKLFIYHQADIHTQNYLGLTPLHIAVTKGHFEVVKLLLACGAKPWYADCRNRTPMHIAIENIHKNPHNPIYHNILAYLEAHNSFKAFMDDLLNFDEPANKKRKIDSSEF